jgi:ketosteroid isomerase-like protein
MLIYADDSSLTEHETGREMIDTPESNHASTDEAELRAMIDRWSKAVRAEDLAGIRADHDPNILMFDVPPPFQSCGLDAYMATWDEFLACQAKPVQFDFHDIAVTAGSEVAFATAIGRCCDLSSGEKVDLDFRLTMGFRKVDGRWRIMHEHHSIPATS